jgi:hypothetical protein
MFWISSKIQVLKRLKYIAAPATREPRMMISQILMVIDNYNFVGVMCNFEGLVSLPISSNQNPGSGIFQAD